MAEKEKIGKESWQAFEAEMASTAEDVENDFDRSEVLKLLNREHLGRAIIIKTQQQLQEDGDVGTSEVTPDGIALAMNKERTRHLVLFRDGHMVLLHKPQDNTPEAKIYEDSIVGHPVSPENPNPTPMVYEPPLDIPQLIDHFGFKDRSNHKGWVIMDSAKAAEFPQFNTVIMGAVNISCGMQGIKRERGVTIEKRVLMHLCRKEDEMVEGEYLLCL